MGENSNIEWCDGTFNPWIGCSKVGIPGCATGCANCYAERDFDHRKGRVKWGPNGTRSMTSVSNWNAVINMGKKFFAQHGRRMRLFCASLADVYEGWTGQVLDHKGEPLYYNPFIPYVPGEPILHLTTVAPGEKSLGCSLRLEVLRRWLFELIDATPEIEWLLLTKRPENILGMTPGVGRVRSNVRFGTSVEHQQAGDLRLPELIKASSLSTLLPFVSAEPLLGGVTLERWLADIGWVITGGESGPHARPGHPTWYRTLRDECQATGTPFLFKQWGEYRPADRLFTPAELVAMGPEVQIAMTEDYTCILHRVGKKAAGRLLDGVEHNGFPLS